MCRSNPQLQSDGSTRMVCDQISLHQVEIPGQYPRRFAIGWLPLSVEYLSGDKLAIRGQCAFD